MAWQHRCVECFNDTHLLEKRVIMDNWKSCMRHWHVHQSECLIYALIQSEVEPHTTIPIFNDNSIFKNMCYIVMFSLWNRTEFCSNGLLSTCLIASTVRNFYAGMCPLPLWRLRSSWTPALNIPQPWVEVHWGSSVNFLPNVAVPLRDPLEYPSWV